jgi:GNAT superfamily N-acetyltransferase
VTSPELIAEDLAPGDAASTRVDWSRLRVEQIRSPDHPLFDRVYERLWQEFGEVGEMETTDVIVDRLAWDPRRPIGEHALLYEMLAVVDGDEIVGLRDHTAIVPHHERARAEGGSARVVVHLSHVLVEPALRGGGLAGWLRALPVQTARECFATVTARPLRAEEMVLVAEMEHPEEGNARVTARLRSYERAGFRKIDPAVVRYRQPDFRPVNEIDATSVQPVPLALVVRRVGREAEETMPGSEVRAIVEALYGMFGVHAAERHMQPLRAVVEALPHTEPVALKPPLSTEGQG